MLYTLIFIGTLFAADRPVSVVAPNLEHQQCIDTLRSIQRAMNSTKYGNCIPQGNIQTDQKQLDDLINKVK